jgi:monoamine oxidase
MSERVDVAVIGAGLAGLTAACELAKNGVSVRVLEARDRVGGRTLSHRTEAGEVVDLGAQWIGPTQDRMSALVDELGLTRVPQHHAGKKALELGGRVRSYRSDIPTLPWLALGDLGRMIAKLELLARKVPLDAPWDAASAEKWDGVTVESWKRSNVWSRAGRSMLDLATQILFAAEPSELSLLFFLHYLHSGGGLMRLINIEGGAQEVRVKEGFQTISIRLAERLGDRVLLSTPVHAIEQTEEEVIVGGLRARLVICAVPLALSGRIRWDPPLPALRDQLSQRVPMGSVIKCIAFYDEPFWRRDGWSGEALRDRGPIRVVFDDSPADGSCGALLGFIAGDDARAWGPRTVAERKSEAIAVFSKIFGPRAEHPIEYVDKPWSEELYSRGCYTGIMGPGVLTRYGPALRAPCGRIHWAGTETAVRWTGYMEGAVESGERAARECMARL